MIYQFFALVLIMAVVYAIAYRRGKTIKEREQEQSLTKTKLENDNPKYQQFCKLIDEMMTDDDFFSDDIAESSKTDTNKDVKKE